MTSIRGRIGLFGHYGNVNLGDEGSFAATLQNIRSRVPDAVITGFTLYPGSTRDWHGIEAFPIRRTSSLYGWTRARQAEQGVVKQGEGSPLRAAILKIMRRIPPVYGTLKFLRGAWEAILSGFSEIGFCWSSFRQLRAIDVLWIAGSNQLEDAHGAWGYPYTLFKWTLLSRLTGTKVLFVSVGASPMRTSASRFFSRAALSRAVYRSYRSVNSKRVAMELGVAGEHEVFPDLAYSLRTHVAPASQAAAAGKLLVGINPMGYFDRRYWPEANEEAYREYLRKLAETSLWLLRSGHDVAFFPTQLAADPVVIEDVLAEMATQDRATAAKVTDPGAIESCDDLLACLRRMDLSVVTRFHGVILSHLVHTPVIAISYEQKIDDAMAATGHSAYCLPIGTFSVEQLKKTIEQMIERRVAVRTEIAHSVSKFKKQLDEQYDRLVKLG